MKLFSKIIRDRGKKGFTLVEMLIVIAVLVIIMAVAVPNAAGYVKRIKLMELDDSARSIYMAVQNKMTVMKQAGVKLEDLAGHSTYDNPDDLPDVFIPPEAVEGAPDDAEYIPPEPRYLRNSKGTENGLVSLTTIEGQLYNHYYVIEYDATTGRVFGVFYSEESDLLQNPNKYPDNYMDEDSRKFENRLHADKLVGYYGGEGKLMKVPTGGEVEKPTNVTDSTLEKLVFMLDPPKNGDEYDKGTYYFEVKITGKDAKDQEHTITIVPYDKDHPENNYYVTNGQRGTVILDSIAPGCGSDSGQWYLPDNHNMSSYTLERDFKGWVYINESSRNSLFSDINNVNDDPNMKDSYSPYVHGIANWNLGKSYVTGEHTEPWKYAQYFRIDPGSDIKVTIKRYKDSSLESDTFEHTVNSYFDSLDGECAVIKAGRHLQNLANQPSVSKVKSARLEKDIDFSEDTGNYDSWNSDVTYKGTPTYPYLYNFKPVNLNYGPSRGNFQFSGKGKDGTQHYIKYIRIDTVEDPRFNSDPDVKKNTAFFSSFYNTSASDVIFYCPVVIGGGDYTGVFFGQCTGGTNITNYTVINPIVESSGKYVGGLFGETNSDGISGHSIYVEEVRDYFDNYTYDYRNRKPPEDILWGDPNNDPYQRFYVKGTGPNTYAGGLIGHSNGQLMNSRAAIRVESTGYAGGLIGYASKKIGKSFVGGHTHNGSFRKPGGGYLINIDGKLGAGGLAAKVDNGVEIDGNYTTCSVSQYDPSNNSYDTFIGTKQSGSNGSYAIGALIDVVNSTIVEKGSTCAGVETDYTKLNHEGDVAKSYDPIHKDKKYPYENGASALRLHYGDWPIPQTNIDGYGIFYWEKEGSAYKIKAVGEFDIDGKCEVSTLCENRDAQSITDYGYGYFYSSEYADSSAGGKEFTDNSLKNSLISALSAAGLHGVEIRQLVASGSGDKDFTFTYSKNATENNTKVFHYNPDFCALSKETTIDHYEIRSFVQLKNLSENNTMANSYWSKKFELSHDIPFSETDAIAPIGVSETPFTGKFDGHLYRIINAKLTASDSDAGIFGYVEDATINGVVVFNADYSMQNLADNAAVGGVIGRAEGTTTITNCAFTGRIVAGVSIGDITAGGIVGVADGDITLNSCEAVMYNAEVEGDDMLLSGTGTITAGGIAGKYRSSSSSSVLKNCYSGGFISASGSENIYVGGIIGTNIDDSDVKIDSCYTYYQTNIPGAHPIGNSISAVASATFTNCYYLGGDWFNQDVGAIDGVKQWEDINVPESDKNNLYSKGLSSTSTAYSDDPITTFEYRLPATISEKGAFYHYGKSPDGTLVLTGDKRFGMFYWECESDGAYHIKAVGGFDVDGKNTVSNLCTGLDGNSITQYGYGYFIGKGIKDGSYDLSGLNGLTASSDSNAETSIKSVLKNLIKNGGESLDTANLREFAFYDFSSSADTSVKSLTINSVEFKFVPGFCAISTGDNPAYKIRTLNHFKNVSAHLSSTFEQTHDIICGYEMMMPIGNAVNPFTGTYDGGCYRIHGLDLKSDENCVGLFGSTNKANIINTFVIEGKIDYTGSNNPTMGGIVGRANDTTIQNCIFTGSIEVHLGSVNSAVIGGIAGSCEGRTLTNCEATADIKATGISSGSSATIGGIVGSTLDASVSSCYSGGSVSQNVELRGITAGGIVGSGNGTATVSNCYTHINIPKFESIENVTVHPIGNNVNPTNCHYIESKNHYAHDFTITDNITKHFDYDIGMGSSSGFGIVNNTYLTGLTAVNNPAYPMPAVVKDGSDFVHYGNWKPIEPLYAPGYGVFYWEKEGNDFHVRVCGIEEVTDGVYEYIEGSDNSCHYVESKDFCYNTDCTRITDYGYGYYYTSSDPIDDIDFNYTTFIENDPQKTAGITKALKDLGISGVDIKWGQGNIKVHKDTTIQLKKKGNTLQIEKQDVYFKFNLDFCYLKMWAGDQNNEPENDKPYEIRNNEQLGNIGISQKNILTTEYPYLNSENVTFKQTHDIIFLENESVKPIGGKGNPFKGKYHGNGYRIVNVKIEQDNTNYIGLFSCTENAEISGIIMYNAFINVANIDINVWASLLGGDERIGRLGGIVGSANNTKIDNCAFYGTINGGINSVSLPRYAYAVGGIVGYGDGNMSISDCESVVYITWKDSPLSASYHLSIGGIAGLTSGNIEHCYSGGNMKAEKGGLNEELGKVQVSAGGIAGSGVNLAVNNCYSYMNMASDIEYADSICLKTFTHQPKTAYPSTTYTATITNCYCLTGENFYNHTVDENGTGITAYSDTQIPQFIATLKTILPDSITESSRYNAPAYGKALTNPGHYPLAAVVKDKDGNYVHYGYVDGLIQYKVDIKATPLSYGSATVDKEYALPDETVTVTAKLAQAIYELESITVDGVKINGNTFTMPEKNVNVVVTFKSRVHNIGFEPMTNGTVSVQSTAEEGTEVTFTVNPDQGYTCKSVTVKYGDTVMPTTQLENGGYSFTMPSGDVTISAEFEKSSVEIDKSKLAIFRVVNDNGNRSLLGRSYSNFNTRIGATSSWNNYNEGGFVLNSDVDVDKIKLRITNSNGKNIVDSFNNLTEEFDETTVNNSTVFSNDCKLFKFKSDNNLFDFSDSSKDSVEIIWINDDNTEQSIWKVEININPYWPT